MFIPTDKALYIDIRSSADVMLYGLENEVDAHIPYLGGPVDEWNVFLQSYRSYANNSFINDIFDLLCEFGLYRDSAIILVARSKRKGLLASSILNVAGYSKVIVKEYSGYEDSKETVGQEGENGKAPSAGEVSGVVSDVSEFTSIVH
ncbi:MAG: hypothetical protein ABW139_11825 [Candidatus Thiodiazotropha sp. DIVDIV]